MNVTRDALRAARDRYTTAAHEFAAAGQERLELFTNAIAAGWDSLDAADELGIPGLFTSNNPPGDAAR
ncbi:hypothetical protein [Nocardia sp. NPDC050406]|uniref:hypothetical protein n=1 Tax=Nocardia sp. NPDC050406 TaxID=3364318 RepID=UPI003789F61C